MKKRRLNSGFTMAELLVVVAIIGVLAGVSFIAVANYQRSMTQLEWDAIAKEIFVAAQNHLTMAETLGYPGLDESEFGNSGTWTATVDDASTSVDEGVYYYTVKQKPSGGVELDPQKAEYMWENLMLPFGSVDETVRTGGSYVIRYRANPGTVLDVFYWANSGDRARFALNDKDYNALYDYRGEENKAKRRSGGKVIGWYGVDKANENNLKKGPELAAPSVKVKNEEKLTVEVTDPNLSDLGGNTASVESLKLIIEGKSSGAKAAMVLRELLNAEGNTSTPHVRCTGPVEGVYSVVLDDITTITTEYNYHFAHLNDETTAINFLGDPGSGDSLVKGKRFIPGENIIVQAIAYSNSVLTNIAYSNEVTTNSLFADISQKMPEVLFAEQKGEPATEEEEPTENSPWITAMIGNIRHLENLDARISWLDINDGDAGKLNITNAMQIKDLEWEEDGGIFSKIAPLEPGCTVTEKTFMPVVPSHCSGINEGKGIYVEKPLVYDGRSIIAKSTTTVDGFDRSETTYEQKCHSIKGIVVDNSSDAGLFGTLIPNSSVSNLALVNFNIATSSGNAGSLVGMLKKDSEGITAVSNVAAYNSTGETAVNVNSKGIEENKGSAGGLIGKIEGGNAKIEKSAAALIVESAGGDAGGLIGTAEGGMVTACYSGGHTIDKKDSTNTTIIGVAYSGDSYNVTATKGTAGGLIGAAGTDTTSTVSVVDCYSTCSATGVIAGGFVGTYNGTAIENCYATGLVKGTDKEEVTKTVDGVSENVEIPKDGAFAYSLSATTISGCLYYEIVNERTTASGELYYLTALGKEGTDSNIAPLDGSADTYSAFVGAPSDWQPALVYDTQLKTYYHFNDADTATYTDQLNLDGARLAQYILKDISRLKDPEDGVTLLDNDLVHVHYGDWPVPEIFVFNTAG